MEEKTITRDYPATGPKTTEAEPQKQPNGFVRFLKFVFVKDIGIKLASILTAGAMFLLMVGLSI